MHRKPSGRLPADMARIRPEAPAPQKGISLDGLHVQPMTEQTRFDAVRAVTHVHLNRPETVAESAVVLAALGLLPERPAAAAGPLDLECAYCDAPAGQRCRSARGEARPIHLWRKRAAANRTSTEESTDVR